MISEKKSLGDFGEEAACQFLVKNGYKILERNFRARFGEIDIVALEGNVLVFVEVKNFQKNSLVEPLEAVAGPKMKKIFRAGQIYLMKNKISNKNIRFDLVALKHSSDGKILQIELFKKIF